MHVLRRMRETLIPGGIVLDLQVIRPQPVVEIDGSVVCEIDGEWLFRRADSARAAVDLLIGEELFVEEFVDDHDVLNHYSSGAELVEDFASKERKIAPDAIPHLLTVTDRCVVRERCRLRRLRI